MRSVASQLERYLSWFMVEDCQLLLNWRRQIGSETWFRLLKHASVQMKQCNSENRNVYLIADVITLKDELDKCFCQCFHAVGWVT